MASHHPPMLHVCWAASGADVAAVPLKGLQDVRALKQQLHKLCGLPECAQRLLHNGDRLDDGFKLESPMNLQLVLSVGASSSLDHQEEVTSAIEDACERRDVKTVCLLLQAGAVVRPDSSLASLVICCFASLPGGVYLCCRSL